MTKNYKNTKIPFKQQLFNSLLAHPRMSATPRGL